MRIVLKQISNISNVRFRLGNHIFFSHFTIRLVTYRFCMIFYQSSFKKGRPNDGREPEQFSFSFLKGYQFSVCLIKKRKINKGEIL